MENDKTGTRIAVLGAGAVGCYYGGLLARAGHEVTLIGRETHVQALRERGLRLQTADSDQWLAVRSDTEAKGMAGADLVLVCVKATDTASAAAAMAPHLKPGALVLSLQNGVDNAERLQARLPLARVHPALVYAAVEMAGAGHLRHHGGGRLVLGESADSEALSKLLTGAGIAVEVVADIGAALWFKLLVNCAYNALSAISRLPYGAMLQGEGVERVMRDAADECMAVAAAEGISLPSDSWQRARAIADAMPTQRSSTAQDLARGRRSEIDHLNGHVVRRGEALGVATPVNRTLHSLVRLIEPGPASVPIPD